MAKAKYVKGLEHDSSNPNACTVGNMVYGAGVFGYFPGQKDSNGKRVFPDSIEQECNTALSNLLTVASGAGLSKQNIGRVIFQVSDRAFKTAANNAFKSMWSDPDTRPVSDTRVDADLSYGRVRLTFEGAIV